MSDTLRAPSLKTILLASGVILSLAMGVRHGFGFWLQPLSQHHGWTRETYSLAMAMQNLMWGIFGPVAFTEFGCLPQALSGSVLPRSDVYGSNFLRK